MSKVRVLAFIFLVGFVGAIFYLSQQPPRGRVTTNPPVVAAPAKTEAEVNTVARRTDLPFPSQQGGFVASEACRECHAAEFESWHDSYHRTMTQVAGPNSVVAPFNVRLSSRGRDCYLSREGEKFFVTMADPDFEAAAAASNVDVDKLNPPMVKREVIMTTGSHHMQSFWVASKHQNMLRQVPWTYLIQDKRWAPREDIFLAPADDPRHFAVWNDNCIVCHAVAGKPNFDLQSMKVNTEVAELGISCEACHGPGAPHIDFQRALKNNALHQSSDPKKADPIVNPAKADPRIAAEICGQCHAYFKPHDWDAFGERGYMYRAGGDLAASHDLMTFAKAKAENPNGKVGMYWNDGTCRVAGREYTAMVNSPCYENGPMTCISCHSSHESDPNDQLAVGMETNEACLKCHEKFRTQLEQHTHHAPQSSGSLCYNCHMPHTSFGVLKAMRSHRVHSPRVVHGEESDHPNGCNLCHLDQSLNWTAKKLQEWYGQPLSPPEADSDLSAAVVWLLRGDPAQRAIAAWHMSWPPALEISGDQWQTPFLAQMLDDSYAAVRYVAGKSLARQLEQAKLPYDYVGYAKDRLAVQRKLTEWWQAQPRPQTAKTTELILDEAGKVDVGKLNDLLKRQDTQALVFPE